MTAPRQIVPGRTLFISRRCSQRQMLLSARGEVVTTVSYLIAEASERYGITMFAWKVMGNHLHMLIRDNKGNCPEFLAHLHKMIAKALNKFWKRRENFWSPDPTSIVWVVTREDAFAKLIYLLTNAVTAGLVDRAREWPGASSLAQNTSRSPRPMRVERPVYFRKNGKMPASATLVAARLDGFEGLTNAQWAKKVQDAVRAAELVARNRRAAKGKKVLGVKAVLATKPTSTPKRIVKKNDLSPQIACRDPQLRKRELIALREFRIAHRAALLRLRAGDFAVVFPPGTYRVREFGIRIAAIEAPRRPSRARGVRRRAATS